MNIMLVLLTYCAGNLDWDFFVETNNYLSALFRTGYGLDYLYDSSTIKGWRGGRMLALNYH